VRDGSEWRSASKTDQLDDATRAFDDLRAEVAVLRRAVEALGPALKENRSPDYSLTLGHIAKTQATIGARLEAIEGHSPLELIYSHRGAVSHRIGSRL